MNKQSARPRTTEATDISKIIVTNRNAKFSLKPKFQGVIQSISEANPTKSVFTYEEVTLLLSKYLLSRKDLISDPRNIKLALRGPNWPGIQGQGIPPLSGT